MPDADKTPKLLIELGVIGQDKAAEAQAILDRTHKTAQGMADEALSRAARATAENKTREEAVQLLHKQREELISSGKSADDLDSAIQDLASGLNMQLGPAAKEAGHHINNARLRGELFRRVMLSIGSYTPGLEYAVMGGASAFGALTAAAIGGGIALEKLIAYFRSFDEELANVTDGELKDHEDAIKRLKTKWDEAQTALGKYYAEMETAGTDGDPIKKQLANLKALTDAQLDSTRKIIEALGHQETAYLRAHGGTPEQISAAEERTRKEIAQIDSRKEYGDGVGGLKTEQATRLDKNDALRTEALKSLVDAATAKSVLKSQQDELADVRAQLDPTTDIGKRVAQRRAEAEASFQQVQKGREHALSPQMTAGMSPDQLAKLTTEQNQFVAAAQKNLDAVYQERANLEKRERQLFEQTRILETEADVAEKKSQQASQRSEINQGRLRELPAEIEQAGKIQAVDDQGRQSLEIINSHLGKSTESFGQLAAAIGLTEQQKLNIVNRILNHTMSLQQAWAGMEARLNQIAHEVQAHGYKISGLQNGGQ